MIGTVKDHIFLCKPVVSKGLDLQTYDSEIYNLCNVKSCLFHFECLDLLPVKTIILRRQRSNLIRRHSVQSNFKNSGLLFAFIL